MNCSVTATILKGVKTQAFEPQKGKHFVANPIDGRGSNPSDFGP